MIFEETAILGVWKLKLEPLRDDRGFFARTFCKEEFCANGLPGDFEQSSLSRNGRKGTLRGMHYQPEPNAEAKLVRCVRGAIFDVAVDLRPSSPTQGRWVGFRLDSDEGEAIFIASGLAHGFQTLEDGTDVLYQITPAFRPGLGRGVRWNDPTFAITWPLADPLISSRDATYADWIG